MERIWFGALGTGEELSRELSVCHRLHTLTPSTKGQEQQAWHFTQNPLHFKNSPQGRQRNILQAKREGVTAKRQYVMKQQSYKDKIPLSGENVSESSSVHCSLLQKAGKVR